MRRIRRIVLLVTVLATLVGGGLAASPADAREPGRCRVVRPWIDNDGRVVIVECDHY